MRVVVLNGDHTAPVQCVQFNPKYMMLATACTNMVSTADTDVNLSNKEDQTLTPCRT